MKTKFIALLIALAPTPCLADDWSASCRFWQPLGDEGWWSVEYNQIEGDVTLIFGSRGWPIAKGKLPNWAVELDGKAFLRGPTASGHQRIFVLNEVQWQKLINSDEIVVRNKPGENGVITYMLTDLKAVPNGIANCRRLFPANSK